MTFVGAFDLALADSDDAVSGADGGAIGDPDAKSGESRQEKARLAAFDRECRIDAARRHGAKSLAHGRASKKARAELAKAIAAPKPDLRAVKSLEEKVARHEAEKDRQRDVLARCFAKRAADRPPRAEDRQEPEVEESLEESIFVHDDEPSVSAYARTDELEGGFSFSDDGSLDDADPEPQPQPRARASAGDPELESLRLRCSRWVEIRRNVKCPSGDAASATCRVKARVLIPCTKEQEAELAKVAREDGLSIVGRVDERSVSAVVDLDEAHVGMDGTLFGYSRGGAVYGVDGLGFARRWRGGRSCRKADGLKASVRRLEARLEALRASGKPDAAAKVEARLKRLRAAAGRAVKTVVDGEATAAGVAAAAEKSEKALRSARAERAARRGTEARKARKPAPARRSVDEDYDEEGQAGDEETMEYVHSPKLPDSSEAAFDAGPVFDSLGDVSNVDGEVMPGGDFALTADALSGYDPEGDDGEGQSGEAYDADGAFGYEDLSSPGPIPELDRGVVVNDFESTPGGETPARKRAAGSKAQPAKVQAKSQRQAGSNDLAKRRGGGKARFGIFGAASDSGMGQGLLSSSISTLNQQVTSAVDKAKATTQTAVSSDPELARLQLERERLAAQERAEQRAAEERASQARMELFSNIFGSATQATSAIVPAILQTEAQKRAQKDATKIELAKASQPIIYQVSGQQGSGSMSPYVPWIVGGIALLGFGGLIVWGLRSGGKGK